MIFWKYAAGMGRGTLRDYLNEAKIPTPLALMHMRGEKYSEYMEIPEHRYEWSIQTISTIVKNEFYLGNTVHLRYRKANHKSKMRKQAKEDQLVLQDTHEPIITEELWEAVQKRFVTHADMTFVHENIFIGLVRCADCGKALNYGKTPRHPTIGKRGKERKTTRYLICATYTTHGKARCTSHYTSYDMLCEIVKLRLNRIIGMVKISEDRVRKEILKSKNQSGSLAAEASAKKLAKNDKRLSEIERIYTKLYEDRALEVVSDENFKMLSIKLQSEQKQLKADNESFRERMAEKEKTTEDIGNFIEVIKSMERIEVLDEEILNALIDRIDIGEKTTAEDGEVYQSVEVSYKFIGNVAF